MAALGLLGGMQFLMLGIIGAYLGRLYDQSKGRPLFMIRDIVGGGPRVEVSAPDPYPGPASRRSSTTTPPSTRAASTIRSSA